MVAIYRLVAAVFCTCWIIRSGFFAPSNRVKWFIHLTNWSFFFLSLYFVCATLVTVLRYKKIRDFGAHQQTKQLVEVVSDCDIQEHCTDASQCGSHDEPEVVPTIELEMSDVSSMRWYHEALWVIYNIAAVGSLFVTILFWSMIYRGDYQDTRAMSVVVHGANSGLIVTETLLCSIPVRLFHVIYPMLYSVAYVVFTVLYWACGGTGRNQQPYIYPQTDFSGQPVMAAVSLLCLFFFGLPLCQTFFFCLYVLRCRMAKKLCN